MKYRRKPVIVDANQWNPEILEWAGIGEPDSLGVVWQYNANGKVSSGFIDTLEGGHYRKIKRSSTK